MNNKFIFIAAILLGLYVFTSPGHTPTQFGSICLIIAGCSFCIVTKLEEILKVLKGENDNELAQPDKTKVPKEKEIETPKKQETKK